MKGMRSGISLAMVFICCGQTAFAGTLAQFHLFAGIYQFIGDVDVELYDREKPITVNNFINLTEAGAFQNGFFHRCVTNFVLQGGGFFALDPSSTNVMAPPYANLGQVGNFGPITNEFHTGPFLSNGYGTIAMAKTSDPNSATSQFFFNLADNAFSLDNTNNSGGFTVFGHVLRGTNELNLFNHLSYGDNLVDLRTIYGTNGVFTSLFTQLPTASVGTNAPLYDELIYFYVTLLTAQVNLTTNGAREISWTSINGVTNRVEYTDSLPGTWQTLTNTIGTNGSTSVLVTDASTNASQRFYRVRILY